MPNIEVEVRSFITPEQHRKLVHFFSKTCGDSPEEKQVTYYFDCLQDLRIQKNDRFSKLWLKSGRIHDEHREEVEVMFSRDDFEKIESIIRRLGFEVEIKWFRTRRRYNWDGIKVCIDYTVGYGHIIELEKLVDEQTRDGVHELLRNKLAGLAVAESPRAVFEERFRHYKSNWRSLLNKEKPAGF